MEYKRRMKSRRSVIRLLPIILLCRVFSGDLLDNWTDHTLAPLDSMPVSVQFSYRVVNDFSDYAMPGSLVVGEDRIRFRYTLGPKTTLYDGDAWMLFDDRTNQLLIEGDDGKSVSTIPRCVAPDSVKSLRRFPGHSPMELQIDIPEVSDSVIVQFSKSDSMPEKIILKLKMSEIWITDIVIGVPDENIDWFTIDTTGKYILDLRE